MSVTTKDVHHIAHLARINISQEQIPEYTENLNKLLNFAAQITAIDTEAIQPMSHPFEGQIQRLREDHVTETDQHQAYQSIAPDICSNFYILPKVIE